MAWSCSADEARAVTRWLAGVAVVGASAMALTGCVGASGSVPASKLPTAATRPPAAVSHHHAAHRNRQPFSARVDRRLTHHRRTMSAAVVRLSDGETVVRNPHLSAYAASILKVAILVAAEQRDRRQGHGLTAAQQSTATPMIEASDNDAATTLWQEAGKARALFGLFRQLGMSHTRRAPTLLEPWDGVRTTTSDQLRLLQALSYGAQGVTEGDRHFVLQLMHRVEPDQDWGVPAGTKPRWSVAVKNGWVPVGSDRWTVNTIGIVRAPRGHDYALAIMTTGSRSEAAGIRKVNAIARSVAHRWG